jgi:hypothetical protein
LPDAFANGTDFGAVLAPGGVGANQQDFIEALLFFDQGFLPEAKIQLDQLLSQCKLMVYRAQQEVDICCGVVLMNRCDKLHHQITADTRDNDQVFSAILLQWQGGNV